MKEQIDWKVLVAGMFCLTVIEIYALSQGMNGTLMALVVGIIAVAIGVAIPKEKIYKS